MGDGSRPILLKKSVFALTRQNLGSLHRREFLDAEGIEAVSWPRPCAACLILA